MSRATPLQLQVMALFGCNGVATWSNDPNECKAVMSSGRQMLVESTGVDFQYDVNAWRAYLLRHLHDEYNGLADTFDTFVVDTLMGNAYAMRLLAELAEEKVELFPKSK